MDLRMNRGELKISDIGRLIGIYGNTATLQDVFNDMSANKKSSKWIAVCHRCSGEGIIKISYMNKKEVGDKRWGYREMWCPNCNGEGVVDCNELRS